MTSTPVFGNKSQILMPSLPSVAMTNLALQDSGDHTTFVVADADDAKRVWDATATFAFETSGDGGTTWASATPASVRYIDGSITFASAVTGTTPMARVASGNYIPMVAVANISKWSTDLQRGTKENTSLTTTSTPTMWQTFQKTLATGSFKINQFLDEDADNLALLTSDDPVVLKLFTNILTGKRIVCTGLLTKESVAANMNDIGSDDLEFQLTGPIYKI